MAWTGPGSIWRLKSGSSRQLCRFEAEGGTSPLLSGTINETTLTHEKTKAES